LIRIDWRPPSSEGVQFNGRRIYQESKERGSSEFLKMGSSPDMPPEGEKKKRTEGGEQKM